MTYFLVRLFGGSSGDKVGRHEVDSLQWWTGAVLTFSVSLVYNAMAIVHARGQCTERGLFL
jgi:hypothetical protein